MKYTYTGKELDAGTGLMYYRARYYDPVLGRFLSPDTLVPEPGNPQSLNRYSYVLNNPLKYTDPSGHWLETAWDIANIAWGIYEVRRDPGNVWNWAALAVDVGATVLPFVPAGVGMVMRGGKAAKAAAEAASHANQVEDAARVVAETASHADEAADVMKAADKTEVVLSGHGGYRPGSGTIVVPEGTEVVTYSKFGGSITDRLGNAIEVGQIPPGTYSRTWAAGQKMPNYTLYPPEGLRLQGSPVTVQKPTLLGDLLKPNMGRVHWAACTTARGCKWYGQIWDIGGVLKPKLPE